MRFTAGLSGRASVRGVVWQCVLLLSLFAAGADALSYSITVSAPNRDYREAPVRVLVDAPKDFAGTALLQNGQTVPSQARLVGGRAEVCWIVRNLKKGQTLRYELVFERVSRGVPVSGVIIDRNGQNLDIRINQELFTRYDTVSGPNKPYFYPLFHAGGKRAVRGYPLEEIAGETKDHPHHRGLWFTHGAVNGADYWSEGANAAKTVHRKYEEVASGRVYGYFRAVTDWIGKEGKPAAEDVREVRVYNVAEGRLMDFEITLKAVAGPVTLGDTKEGTFGLRLPDTMRVRGGGGHIENSRGVRDAAAWGKRAEWVDYYGPVEGEVMGVAILDHPQNLRHPTYWHVRDYGLFAANPFGIHDFERGQAPNAGEHTIPAGGSLTFRYRLFFHKGTAADADIASVWAAYSDPPQVKAIRR